MKPKPDLGGAMSADFNEPTSEDPTSAPPVPQSNISKTLSKKKKGFGPGVKNPADLSRAINQAKRAHQGSHRYG